MLQAEILRPRELSPSDRAAWAAFRAATPAFRSPLLSLEFAEAVGDVRPDAAVAVYRRAGRAVGFLAHHRRPGGLARPIGATWSDHHALVGAPDARIDGAEALRAASLTAFRFSALSDPHGIFAAARAAEQEAHVIVLSGSGEDYWEALRAASPKRFKNMRRLEHKLEREVGGIVLQAPDHDPGAFRSLLGWKSDQFRRTGLHDVLATPWSRTLMGALFGRRDGRLQGLLITLRAGGRPVAAHFGVRLDDAFHPWLAAYDPAMAAYSPGTTIISEAIRAMPGLGLASYDLSAGSDHYKRPFASEQALVREGELRLDRAGGALERVSGLLGAGPARALRRVGRRLDHIAAAELSLSGRLTGVASALAASSRRLEAHAGQDASN